MGTETESVEERLKSFFGQLQAECGVFERIVYKNKNQHRRCSYFQYLLKVRRDLRLLQSAKLEEILGSCFHVITGKKPKQKVYLLESLKWRKCDGKTPNFMERLLGAARLLSQMVEPMLKAATEVSTLLAQSFFMGFSLTILALLARLRVLIQQILLDVVSVFNMVSSISQKKQSVKITQEGIEVFREYYPTNKEFVALECVWKTDKFVLLETTHKSDVKGQVLEDTSVGPTALQYQIVESFLGDDDSDLKKANEDDTAIQGSTHIKVDEKDLSAISSIEAEHGYQVDSDGEHSKQVDSDVEAGDIPVIEATPDKKLGPEDGASAASSSSPSLKPLTPESSVKQVAFVSIKRPAPSTAAASIPVKRPASSTANATDFHVKETEKNIGNEDSFFNFLAGGNLKDTLL